MPDRIALAVIGCGFFAGNHLHSWSDLKPEGVDIAAVCDADPAKAKAAAERFGVPRWYTDARAMFEAERLGLVDIVTRVETHRELVGLALAHRVPTIVQKPFGPALAVPGAANTGKLVLPLRAICMIASAASCPISFSILTPGPVRSSRKTLSVVVIGHLTLARCIGLPASCQVSIVSIRYQPFSCSAQNGLKRAQSNVSV